MLEYTLGLNDSKPIVFEEIDDKIADMKSSIEVNKTDVIGRMEMIDSDTEKLTREVKHVVSEMDVLTSLMTMRDQET